MPTWLYYAIPAACLAGVIIAFVWGVCEASSQADDALDAERENAMEPQLADDAWDHMLRSDPSLVAWAHDTVDPPKQDRDLGQLAAWADSVTDRRAS